VTRLGEFSPIGQLFSLGSSFENNGRSLKGWISGDFVKNSSGTDVMILKIFWQKNLAKKIGVFDSKQSYIMQIVDHDIGFREKRQFFSPKICKNRRKL
jgi:hypothetical protein